MNVLNHLASRQDRRDEIPNAEQVPAFTALIEMRLKNAKPSQAARLRRVLRRAASPAAGEEN